MYEREFCPSFRIKQLLYRIEGWSVFNWEPLQFTFLTVLMKPACSVDAMYRNTWCYCSGTRCFYVSNSCRWKWSIQFSLASVSLQRLECFYKMIYASWSVIYKEIYKEKTWMSTKDRRALLSCTLFTRWILKCITSFHWKKQPCYSGFDACSFQTICITGNRRRGNLWNDPKTRVDQWRDGARHDRVTDITTVRLTNTSFIDLCIFCSLVKNQSLWICCTHHPSQQLNLQSCRVPSSIQKKSISIQAEVLYLVYCSGWSWCTSY